MTAISSRPPRSMRRRERLGPLHLHERLDSASVHLGWLLRAGRLVAVKRLHPLHLADAAGIARVREEARIAMRVDHPNVVATLGVVHRSGESLAAMTYVAGASLAEIADAVPEPLSPRVASAIAADALRGLHAAHDARGSVVPRAVSPSRVLVGEDGRARVLDFDAPGARAAAAVVDDLPYASPEQLVRAAVDVRRDVYAASVVLWETLARRALFRAPTVEGMLRKILEGDVPAPSRFAPGIDRALDAIVLRGLARDPRARFESARAMASALEQASCAAPDDVARTLAGLDLPCIRRRRAVAEAVCTREARDGRPLHTECNGGLSKD
ncbi:MAG: serine/threonine protein kinase [Labilithrix sp.]|nr:serine/threonine protein kinase [Labilithrix sp.]